MKKLAIFLVLMTALAFVLMVTTGCKPTYQPDTPMSSIPPNKVIKDCQDAIHAQECLSLYDTGTRHAPATYLYFWAGKGSERQAATRVKACDQRSQPIPCVLVYRSDTTHEITHYEIIGYNKLPFLPNP